MFPGETSVIGTRSHWKHDFRRKYNSASSEWSANQSADCLVCPLLSVLLLQPRANDLFWLALSVGISSIDEIATHLDKLIHQGMRCCFITLTGHCSRTCVQCSRRTIGCCLDCKIVRLSLPYRRLMRPDRCWTPSDHNFQRIECRKKPLMAISIYGSAPMALMAIWPSEFLNKARVYSQAKIEMIPFAKWEYCVHVSTILLQHWFSLAFVCKTSRPFTSNVDHDNINFNMSLCTCVVTISSIVS